jgi:hypothetical protein
MKLPLTIVITFGVAAAGCATTPIPADKLSRSVAAVRSAEVANADQVPNASAHLRLAREQIGEAKSLLKRGDNEQASYLLIRAEADADAAMNLAREAQVKQDAMQTIESVRAMKSQMEVPKS